MSQRFLKITERLHRMHVMQQRQEESELARKVADHHTHQAQLSGVIGETQRARELRMQQMDGRSIQAWNAYLALLTTLQDRAQSSVVAAEEQVVDQKTRLQGAYQDTRRWEVIRDRMRDIDTLNRARDEQKALDEAAVTAKVGRLSEW
jgi:flagellar export protein FliJ